MTREDWERPHGRVLVAVLLAPAQGDDPADRVAVAFNAGKDALAVRWPDARPGFQWHRAVDTSDPDAAPVRAEAVDALAGRSVVLLVEEPGTETASR